MKIFWNRNKLPVLSYCHQSWPISDSFNNLIIVMLIPNNNESSEINTCIMLLDLRYLIYSWQYSWIVIVVISICKGNNFMIKSKHRYGFSGKAWSFHIDMHLPTPSTKSANCFSWRCWQTLDDVLPQKYITTKKEYIFR